MDLATEISKFIDSPFPLWETQLTQQLVQHKWRELQSEGFTDPDDYNTAYGWLKNASPDLTRKTFISKSAVSLELPSFRLSSFYGEHGLELLSENELQSNGVREKLAKAFSILQHVDEVYTCVTNLVWSLQVLRQPDKETDVSYSHPQIPFSIFVSVCEDDSTISSLRVAESILHEAMHLKLTLIENIAPLVEPNTTSTFYSPWRGEERPVRGVLHALFVFRAILNFYEMLSNLPCHSQVADNIVRRRKELKTEFILLKNFHENKGLTYLGANLVASLLPLN